MQQVKRTNSIVLTVLLSLSFILSGCGSKDEVATTDPVINVPANPPTVSSPAPAAAAPDIPAPAGNNYVQYEGTTLVVFGKYYYPVAQDPRSRFASGQLIVASVTGKLNEFSSLLEQLSLEVISYTGTGSLLVKVPSGFEEQWVRALSDQASVKYAELDGIMTTQ